LNTVVNREDLMDLVECVERSTDFLFMAFGMHIQNDELRSALEERLYGIKWHLKRVFYPELDVMKKQARLLYQKWLALKKSDEKAASQVYLEYLKVQCKIKLHEIPF